MKLFRTRKIDIDFLVRYSNAAWLVIDNPRSGKTTVCLRVMAKVLNWSGTAKRTRLSATRRNRSCPISPQEVTLADGQKAKPVLRLMADMYCDEAYAPEAVAEQTGIAAETIRGLAAEIAKVAFEEEIIIDQPWTDRKGEKHDHMIGRPVTMHAMRGISAHSNGFQTCRALHILQILIGSVDCHAASVSNRPTQSAQSTPQATRRLQGRPAPQRAAPGLSVGPGSTCLMDEGRQSPLAHRQGVFPPGTNAASAAHGLNAHGHFATAHAGDPLQDRSRSSCTWPTWRGTRR